MFRNIAVGLSFLALAGCASMKFEKTVENIDLQKFMGQWYVWAGRTTFLEEGAHNAVEIYTWNEAEKRIDIEFRFNQNAFDGPPKRIPQKAWIHNSATNAHWKVRPFWPLKFDYLVIALGGNYEWTAIGVPSGRYLWIMGRKPHVSDSELKSIVDQVGGLGYPTQDVSRIPQQWPL